MADPTFNLFGPPKPKDLTVGYISTDRGYQEGVSICDANVYAKVNPGTTFIFKPNKKTVEFLNINQVNQLTRRPPSKPDESCPDGLDMHATPEPPKVVFMGGGGVGAVANPIIGDDGAVLGVDLVNGGFGYKYPPIVHIQDDSGIGAGAVVKVDVGEIKNQLIYYSDKEDFEEYEICDTGLPKDEFGRRWGPDGKDLGDWNPQAYTDGAVPFAQVVDEYIKKVQSAGKDWFTTRKNPPLKVTSTAQSNTTFFKVKHPTWGNFMNEYAISPKPPSNVKPSDFAGHWFTFEWNVDFPYDGEYIFRTARDDKSRIYIDNVPYTDKLITNTGTKLISGKSGSKGGHGNKITIKKGPKVLRLDLYNQPQMETVTVQQPPPPSKSDVTFKITTGSMFANGVRIDGLDINESKPFTQGQGKKAQLNVSHTRKVQYGRKYKVVFSTKGKPGVEGDIKYNGLNAANNPITLTNDKRNILLKDGDGNDTNFSLTIDSGKGKFSDDGMKLNGVGTVQITASWNDNPGNAGVAVDSIEIGGKTWRRTGRRGSQTHTLDLGSAKPQPIKLRTKNPNVIQMEEFHDNDWTDLIVVASSGQFTDLKGNVAYFSVPHPPDKKGESKSSKGIQTREVFNTVDYISKANRQLWRTNVYTRGGFLNDYGICPFDTKLQLKDNPYAGDHTIVWPNVNFPIDGNYTIEVAVDDNVDLTIGNDVRISKKGFTEGVSTGTLKTTRFVKGGNHNIIAKLNQIPGGAFSFKAPDGKTSKTKIKFNVWIGGDYGNRMTIPGLFSLAKEYKGEGAGLNKELEVEIGKEYDVILTSIRSRGGTASSEVRKGAIRFRKTQDGSGGIGSKGPRLEYEDLLGRAGRDSHKDITASVSQGRFYAVDGNRCKFMVGESMKGINPMALAINIETEFSEKEIQSKKSWNENPMGVALTIDAPRPPVPQQPVPKAEGRCPNNPFWTTRFPGAKQLWYPVRFPAWGSLMNELAMSPLLPDDEGDARNDTGSFTNTWTKSFPYGGWYKVIMAADNWGQLWIDDEKVIDMSKGSGNSTFTSQVEKLVYIDGPTSIDEDPVTHEIKVVVENEKSLKTKTIDAKVFNTIDWLSGGTSKVDKKRVRFKIKTGSMFANSIKIPELDIHESKEFTPVEERGTPLGQRGQLNVTRSRDVEVNKVYDVEFFSSSQRQEKNWGIKYTGLKEGNLRQLSSKRLEFDDNPSDGFDVNGAFTIDSGNVKFSSDGNSLIVNGTEATFTFSWNDNPNISGRCVESIKISDKTWRITQSRRGSITQTVKFGNVGKDNTSNVRLRTKGESVIQMEDHKDNDWTDLVCGVTEGKFFDLKGNKCKYMVSSATKVSGGLSGSTTKNGVTYKGPHLFHYTDTRWGKIINREGVSPIGSPTQSLSEPNDNISGKKILTWENVDFPQKGKYDISLIADNNATMFIDDKKVDSVKSNFRQNEYNTKQVDVEKGKHNIRVELINGNESNIFLKDPTGVAIKITTKRKIGTGEYKPWSVNPMGVAAKLIPPPCPKPVKGKGVVKDPIVKDPGNGYPKGDGPKYPVQLKIKEVIVDDPGINYDCRVDKIRLEPSMGSELKLVCGPFGKIERVDVLNPGLGFTRMPAVIIDSDTGVNAEISTIFGPEIAPFDVPDIIQVTDLVGLKQTGYYKGKPYYGAVFYENGVKYSGWYRTAGEMVRVYDTMQESIDASVTTPPSAILRQGSDTSSNDPRLNIPGTPENLI